MKLIQLIAYTIYHMLLFIIVSLAILSIVVIAELSSWYLLLLYVPIGLFVYHSEAINFRNKKHAVVKRKIFH